MSFIPYPHTLTFPGFRKETLKLRSTQISTKASSVIPICASYLGTVKVHGTNATLVFRNSVISTFTVQSRNKIVNPGHADNAGSAGFLTAIPDVRLLVIQIFRIRHAPIRFNTLVIAGEFAGKGILKGAGVCELERFFYIFNIAVDGEWVDMTNYATVSLPSHRIFNAFAFKTFRVQLNLHRPDTGLAQMQAHTNAVAAACPVAAQLGGGGPGEGIVWAMNTGTRYITGEIMAFKTKNDAFVVTANMPRITPNSVMNEVAKKFVEYALGKRRLEQGVEYMREMGHAITMANIKLYAKWVMDDAVREEREAMEEMGASESMVRGKVSEIARKYWFELCLRENM